MKYVPRSFEGVAPQGLHQRPVVGLDIDGTLGEYHGHFLRFARDYLGKPVQFGYDGSVPLYKWLGISKTTYRQVKLAYRRGGLKRSMPAYAGASSLAHSLRRRGALVAICTTRPYLQLEAVEADTTHWLRRNGIAHDAVITGEHKYRDLVKTYGAKRIVFVLDDLPELLRQAESAGIERAWLRFNAHNVRADWTRGVTDLDAARRVGLHAIKEWEQRQ